MFYILPFITAFILSLLLTPIFKNLALKLKILDTPVQQRKIHTQPTPLLGGLALFLAFATTTIIFWATGFISDAKISDLHVIAILTGGLVLMIGGTLDDKYNLKPIQQLIFPVVATLFVLYAGIKVQFITNPLGGVIEFPLLLGTVFAFFWILGMIYTTKLLDGLDGLLSGVTAIGAMIIFGVSLFWDAPLSGTSVMALILAGSAFGFLIFNWHPAKIFLGEGGSVFVGFILGVLAIISGSKIATALLIMGIPILDVIWVIFSRIWQGNKLATGDRKHLHFRLFDLGLSHRQVVVALYFITTAFGLTSLFLHSLGKVIALVLLSIFMVILALSIVIMYKYKNGVAKK